MNNDASYDIDDIGIVFTVPLAIKRRSGRRQVITPPTGAGGKEFVLAHQEAIVIAIARAHRWRNQLEDGTYESLTDLATHINQDISFTARLLRLTQLSPRVIEAIFAGEEPDGLSLNTLTKLLPVIWEEQEAELGFPM
jgi:hypothetical protein